MRLHHLVLDIETYSKQTSTQRLVSFILQHLPAALSPDDGSGVIEFELPDKKLLIASRLCLAPETLSRSLQELRDKNLIDIKGRLIVIKNFAGLRDYR